jgi:hypothetical protein
VSSRFFREVFTIKRVMTIDYPHVGRVTAKVFGHLLFFCLGAALQEVTPSWFTPIDFIPWFAYLNWATGGSTRKLVVLIFALVFVTSVCFVIEEVLSVPRDYVLFYQLAMGFCAVLTLNKVFVLTGVTNDAVKLPT